MGKPIVYVVDDDDGMRRALTLLLSTVGYATEAYSRPSEFLAHFKREEPGCLVLDIRMPGMSGLELQRTMAAAGRTIPIVFITAHDNPAIRLQALGSGAVDVLPKPFGEAALLRAIKIALAAGKAQAEEEE